MSELRSVVETLRAETLSELPDQVIEEDFCELHAAMEALEQERLRRLAEVDRRRIYERDGHLSMMAWLCSKFTLAWGTAREQVRMARALEHMPKASRALEEGELSISGLRVLVSARDTDPEAFAASEQVLVQAARIHTISELRRVAAYWAQAAAAEQGAASAEERSWARRRLHASPTLEGTVRVDGDLHQECGENLLTAIGAVEDDWAREGGVDERTPSQRRADALGEICRQWLDLAERPTVAGERPHLVITVDTDALQGQAGARCEADHVGPVSPELARRLACDASVRRVVMAGGSEPLDVGRRTPLVSPAIRRAVVVRDRGCRFPGCERPHTWCDAHHVLHWADEGETATSNLLLLCRRHHRMVHTPRRFRLELEDGRAVFRRPDGSVLEGRAPP